jgi:hypothetical protein
MKALKELTADVERANKQAKKTPGGAKFTHHVKIVNYKTGKTGLYWRESIVLESERNCD